MPEDTTLAERTQPEQKPARIWSGALKMVKGESTAKMIESFTAEMTLVAEGLVEDQSKVRREMDHITNEADRRFQRLESKIDHVDAAMDEEREAYDRSLTELRNRLAVLEKKLPRESAKEKKSERNRIRDLTWLIGVAGAVLIISLLISKLL